MKIKIYTIFLCFACVQCFGQQKYKDYSISAVNLKNVELTDSFWLPKIKIIQNTTIPYAFDKCQKEGRMESFLIAGGKLKGKVRGKMPFDDSDLYKIIEGASYSLIILPNKELDAYLDSVIDIIKTGQESDGYLTTWFTIDPNNPPSNWVQKTGKRWTGESGSHELYNSGHLFEAAAAHYIATGKRNLLDIAIKNADLLVNSFGPGKLTIPPGHQIVETGLIKLYRITGNEKYLRLAKYFLDWRGDPNTHKLYGEYSQDNMSVVRQTQIQGHAVRAVYMYAAMADIAAIYNNQAYLNAVKKIWDNLVEKKMYITGGIGARHEQESFGKDYELPNSTAYGETCASIGDVYWNHRLFLLTGDAKYYDIIERTLYNGLISGISLDGEKFFYVNPLEADGKFKFNNQGSGTRQSWFDCSCCPTNLIRFIPSLPGLIYATQGDCLYVNLYISNKTQININGKKAIIEQQSDCPWKGNIEILINPEKSERFTLKLRIPGWAQNKPLPSDLYSYTDSISKTIIKINGQEIKYEIKQGYAEITRKWKAPDKIEIVFPMSIRHIIAKKEVKDDNNLAALEYGPIVYCFEGIDNNNQLGNLTLPDNAVLNVEKRDDLLNGVNVITGEINTKEGQVKIIAVPYFAWSNRGEGTMKIWLPRK